MQAQSIAAAPTTEAGSTPRTGTAGLAFSRSTAHYARPRGVDLLSRVQGYEDWRQARIRADVWPFARTLKAAPLTEMEILDECGRNYHGINFASQDYLSLAAHPAVREAAREALDRFGPHSAGSPALLGNTTVGATLAEEIAETLGMAYATLYPTGWAAGFGAITALVRSYDYIVMDELAHACLQAGAAAATPNIVRHRHLDVEEVRSYLRTLRAKDTQNGVLVVTEGLFSMDSDTPDLAALQDICHAYNATLLVDIAHDFGALGPGGTGSIGLQSMLGKVDLVMGSFSKTFASNGGFVATNLPAVLQYLKYYGSPHTFSNALSPMQAAIVHCALDIVRSPEGDERRAQLRTAVDALRAAFDERSVACMGQPSAIVPVLLGNVKAARLASAAVARRGVLANLVEFPAVAVDGARFRFQVMAEHTVEQARTTAYRVADALHEVHVQLNGNEVH